MDSGLSVGRERGSQHVAVEKDVLNANRILRLCRR